MSRTAAAEADVADSSALADAYYEEATTNLTLFKEVNFEDEVVGYQCFDNGSILVPLTEGGNQTVHSPEDVNANVHKVCMCAVILRTNNYAVDKKRMRFFTLKSS